MTTPDLYQRTLEGFGQCVHAVGDDQWYAATSCCPEGNVRDVVGHVIKEQLSTPALPADVSAGADDQARLLAGFGRQA